MQAERIGRNAIIFFCNHIQISACRDYVNNDWYIKEESWPGYPLSGYTLATPGAPKHWQFLPEVESLSDDSRWVLRLLLGTDKGQIKTK